MSASQRDIFLEELLSFAIKDKKIMLLTADMGAPSIDVWRQKVPTQILQTGIAEQSTINFAAGLSSQGYKVYVYTMGCWAARCFEQLRYSCAVANIPITFLSVGVGLGYVPSGPAHEPTEDIAYLRSLVGIEIYSPSNNNMIKSLVDLTLKIPKFRCIRFERSYDTTMDCFYKDINFSLPDEGMVELFIGKDICIVSSGYMMGRATKIKDILKDDYINLGVIDLWRIKPIYLAVFHNIFKKYSHIVTLEEQTLSGGFGSAICEASCDLQMYNKIYRIGLPEKYIFDNGTREEVLNANGLSIENITKSIKSFYH